MTVKNLNFFTQNFLIKLLYLFHIKGMTTSMLVFITLLLLLYLSTFCGMFIHTAYNKFTLTLFKWIILIDIRVLYSGMTSHIVTVMLYDVVIIRIRCSATVMITLKWYMSIFGQWIESIQSECFYVCLSFWEKERIFIHYYFMFLCIYIWCTSSINLFSMAI